IQRSRILSRLFVPFANVYVKASGHRRLGLRYDDLLIVEREDVDKAVTRLSPDEAYDRAWRIRRSFQQSILHKDLPKIEWLKPEDDVRYLTPLIEGVLEEEAERAFFDTAEAIPTRK
ncbi:hypothetical protein BS47DRAFT_1293516, partial [Hydnum rufescens UP504]